MDQKEFFEFARTLFDDMLKLMKAKNADYTAGGKAFANFNGAEEWGVDPLVGLMLRFEDKVKRLKSFCKNGTLQVKSESVDDAMKDIIGYMTLALGMLEAKKRMK